MSGIKEQLDTVVDKSYYENLTLQKLEEFLKSIGFENHIRYENSISNAITKSYKNESKSNK